MLERIREAFISRVRGEQGEGGFTLVELLIVVVVLGILAAVTVFGLSNTAGTSATAACNTDARAVESADAAYQAADPNLKFAPDIATLISQGHLKSPPNNPNHYSITVNANGVVFVTNLKNNTGPFDYEAGLNATPVANPCNGV